MKILLIKLGADGDVLRTIPLANALKNKFPHAEITWLTKGEISSLLTLQKSISRVLTLPYHLQETYDLLYNFDIEEEATSLAESIQADKKYGFFKKEGYLSSFNLGGEYYIGTIFDDALKKTNTRTYQDMMFEVADLPYNKETYSIILSEKDKIFAKEFLERNNLHKKKIVGIHMGASSRWPSKVWHESKLVEFIKMTRSHNLEVILFGGPNEVKSHALLVESLKKQSINICQNNPRNTKGEFAALVSLCDIMVCSDSFALHLSIGLGKPTIGLFFCTSPNEVEGYGLLTKIVSPNLYEFFPEKSDLYDENLVSSISASQVYNSLKNQI